VRSREQLFGCLSVRNAFRLKEQNALYAQNVFRVTNEPELLRCVWVPGVCNDIHVYRKLQHYTVQFDEFKCLASRQLWALRGP